MLAAFNLFLITINIVKMKIKIYSGSLRINETCHFIPLFFLLRRGMTERFYQRYNLGLSWLNFECGVMFHWDQ